MATTIGLYRTDIEPRKPSLLLRLLAWYNRNEH